MKVADLVVGLTLDSSRLKSDIAKAVGKYDNEKITIKAVADTKAFSSDVNSAVGKAGGEKVTIRTVADTSAFTSEVNSAIGKVKGEKITVKVSADTGGFVSDVSKAGDKGGEKASEGFSDTFKAGIAGLGAAAGVIVVAGFMEAVNREQQTDATVAALGLSPKDAEIVGKAAANVYAGAWGDSMAEVQTAIKTAIGSGLVDTSAGQKAIEDTSAMIIDMARLTGSGVEEISRTAGTLLQTGIAKNAQEAFDIITKGQQEGLNESGDWLDTLNEYSNQFAKIGLSGQDALGLISSMMQAGARDSDIAADAIKEFTIKSLEPLTDSSGKLTALGDAFKTMGLNGAQMQKDLAAGGEPARAAFDKITGALQGIQDPLLKSQTGVALFGTQWEDLGTATSAIKLDGATGAFDDIAGSAKTASDTMNDNFGTAFEGFKRGVKEKIAGALDAALPAFEKLGGWLQKYEGWITPVAAGFAAAATALAVWRGAVMAAIVVQHIWNAVMLMNPIGLIVVALIGLGVALVTAYNKSETFRNFVQTAWEKIKEVVVKAWEDHIKPALEALWKFITETLIPIMQDLWNNVIYPIWQKISEFIKKAWEEWIKPALNAMWTFITDTLIPILKDLWENVIKPTWQFISDAIDFAWNYVIKPVLKALWAYINDVLIPIFKFLWNNVIKPVWDAISSAISWAWDNVIKPVFDKFVGILGTLKGAFETAVSAIGTIWNGLKELLRKPVNFVIDTIYNNGIRKVINFVKPGDDLQAVDLIPASGGGGGGWTGGHFASGGVLPGFTPGRDVHQFWSPTAGGLALSGGEAIMRPEWVKAVGGPSGVAKINANAKKGILDSFAGGGIFRPTRIGSYSGGIHGSPPAVDVGVPVGTPVYAGHSGKAHGYDLRGYEPRAPHGGLGYRSYGRVVEIAGEGRSTLYAHLSKRIGSGMVLGGQMIGLSGNTGHSFGPHLHFGARGLGPQAYGRGSTNYSGEGAMIEGDDSGNPSWLAEVINIFRIVKNAITSAAEGFLNIRTLSKELANNVVDMVNDKIWGPGPLPHLAKGGIVTRPTLGLIGEKGPEAVIPLRDYRAAGRNGPAVVIQNYHASEKVDVEQFFRTAEFHIRAGRI